MTAHIHHSHLSRACKIDRDINQVQLADEVIQVREVVCLKFVEQLHWRHHHSVLQAVAVLVQDVPPLVQCLNKSRVTCQLS